MDDVVIRNGTVVDGTGRPPERSDVVVREGHIAERRLVRENSSGELQSLFPVWVDGVPPEPREKAPDFGAGDGAEEMDRHARASRA